MATLKESLAVSLDRYVPVEQGPQDVPRDLPPGNGRFIICPLPVVVQPIEQDRGRTSNEENR